MPASRKSSSKYFAAEFADADKFLKKLEIYRSDVVIKVERLVKSTAIQVESEAKKRCVSDMSPSGRTGRLRSAIHAFFPPSGRAVSAIVAAPSVKYARWVEYGRKPGKPPPSDVMERWAQRIGKPGMGFVFARSIGKKGTKPHPFLMPVWRSILPGFKEKLRKLLKWGKRVE